MEHEHMVVRRNTPLLVGKGDDGKWFATDYSMEIRYNIIGFGDTPDSAVEDYFDCLSSDVEDYRQTLAEIG